MVSSLQVYLFELTSVTVAATRGIVRTFRDREGDYLLVLTDDFERLDFALDRFTQSVMGVEQPWRCHSFSRYGRECVCSRAS